MSEEATEQIRRGQRLVTADGRSIGKVDAVFADYLLVRTGGLLPVDLYVPRPEVTPNGQGRLVTELSPDAAYEAWHRPLKRAPHD